MEVEIVSSCIETLIVDKLALDTLALETLAFMKLNEGRGLQFNDTILEVHSTYTFTGNPAVIKKANKTACKVLSYFFKIY